MRQGGDPRSSSQTRRSVPRSSSLPRIQKKNADMDRVELPEALRPDRVPRFQVGARVTYKSLFPAIVQCDAETHYFIVLKDGNHKVMQVPKTEVSDDWSRLEPQFIKGKIYNRVYPYGKQVKLPDGRTATLGCFVEDTKPYYMASFADSQGVVYESELEKAPSRRAPSNENHNYDPGTLVRIKSFVTPSNRAPKDDGALATVQCWKSSADFVVIYDFDPLKDKPNPTGGPNVVVKKHSDDVIVTPARVGTKRRSFLGGHLLQGQKVMVDKTQSGTIGCAMPTDHDKAGLYEVVLATGAQTFQLVPKRFRNESVSLSISRASVIRECRAWLVLNFAPCGSHHLSECLPTNEFMHG
eukprot:TRINITY_DN1637_c0_g4_i1.p1 TRINITY_DN1637_c0_g4~~TRINITY_DN1637_c0_g4_i1.p1  ORF type:complete len:411 (-),score=20.63 TRINITY_DN1637_c0_g4_i1:48-1109(-)